jgi:hypothetical protein
MYRFKKLDNNDEYLLIADDKQIKFKRVVEDAKKLESINALATMKAIEYVAKQGYTMDNNPYIVERKENGKIIRDESNWNYIINVMKEQATGEIIQDIIKDKLQMDLETLLTKVLKADINNEEDIKEKTFNFMKDFMYIIKNGEVEEEQKTPIRNN